MAPKSKQKQAKDEPNDLQLDEPQDFTHPALSLLDSALRCPLCYEVLKAPVIITSCSHSFCSLCIRESMTIKKECPVDHTAADEGRIRPNKSLDEVISAWHTARSALLTLQSFSTAAALANDAPQPSSSELRSSTADPTLQDDQAEASRLNGYATRSRGAQNGSAKDKGKVKPVEVEDDSSDIEIVEERPSRSTSASAMAAKGKTKGKGKGKASTEDPSDPNIIVLCPMCQGSFRNLDLNLHLDKCDGTKPPTTRVGGTKDAWGKLLSSTGTSSTSSSASKEKGAGSSPQFDTTKPLPLASYSGLKVSALKKKLEDLSLPTTPPPSLTTPDSKIAFLRRRHQQWTTLWNANADVDPKNPAHQSHKELVKELLKWEEKMDGSEKVEIDGKAYSVGSLSSFSIFPSPACLASPRLSSPPAFTERRVDPSAPPPLPHPKQKAHASDFRTLIQQARESQLAKKQQQELAARAVELESELGELREEVEESQSQEMGVGVGSRVGEDGDEEMEDGAEAEEEEKEERQPQPRTSSTVRFAASPTHRSTPPLSSPTPTTHTLTATHTTTSTHARSPCPTGSLDGDLSPSPSPPPPPPRVLEEEQEAENRKRKREFSPYDPRGPRPSQM
ncbi:hypothetical protein BCR35DRAFT_355756, partial [Leucosporidium creatinivorum]